MVTMVTMVTRTLSTSIQTFILRTSFGNDEIIMKNEKNYQGDIQQVGTNYYLLHNDKHFIKNRARISMAILLSSSANHL